MSTHYVVGERIGGGSFGDVFHVTNSTTGERFVVKRMKESPDASQLFLREIAILSQVQHRHVVQLVDVIAGFGLVLAPAGRNLKTILESDGPMDAELAVRVLLQMLNGLEHLHEKQVIHADLKPDNVAMSDSGTVRLLDVGNSVISLPDFRSLHTRDHVTKYGLAYGTLWYRAIETLLGDVTFSTPSDIWAVGCVAVELVTAVPLFREASAVGQIFRIFSTLGSPHTPAELAFFSVLPLYSQQMPRFPRRECVLSLDGPWGALLTSAIDCLLRLLPSDRPTARETQAISANLIVSLQLLQI